MGNMNEAPTGVRPHLRTVLSVLGVVVLTIATVVLVAASTAGSSRGQADPNPPSTTMVGSTEASPTPSTSPATSDPITSESTTQVPPAAPEPADTAAGEPVAPQPPAAQIASPAAVVGGSGLGANGVFRMTGPAPVDRADYGPMAYVLPLNPPGPQNSMVRWVDGMGVSPGAADQGTVYILGHAWAQQWLVFNGFSELATRSVDLGAPPQQVPAYGGGTVRRWSTPVLNGSRITMSDAGGRTREWSVDNTWLVPKSDAINDIELNSTDIPGRIILIACSVGGGRDLDYNVIVSGHLV